MLMISFSVQADQGMRAICAQGINPIFNAWCYNYESNFMQSEAKRKGAPKPSREVVGLPAYGSAEAKLIGAACAGGAAMMRVKNGWHQIRNDRNEWLRCAAE